MFAYILIIDPSVTKRTTTQAMGAIILSHRNATIYILLIFTEFIVE